MKPKFTKLKEKKATLEDVLFKELKLKHIKPGEIPTIIKNLKDINPIKYSKVKIDFPDNHVKFLMFGDAHMGHANYRPDIMRKMIKDAKHQGCEFAVNTGDTIEGMSGRDGHIYELTHLGASDQLRYFETQFRQFGKLPVYSIEAQNSHGGWFKSKGNTGLDIGEELDRRSKPYKFIGYDEQDLELDNGLKIRLRHPGGGTAYAISYKMQKYAESIGDENKPHVIGQGHFHKSNYMFYRNMHCYDTGALQEQSPWMKKTNSPSHLGYWIVDVNMNKRKNKSVERVTNQFVSYLS